jgi:hypothetical protein
VDSSLLPPGAGCKALLPINILKGSILNGPLKPWLFEVVYKDTPGFLAWTSSIGQTRPTMPPYKKK